MVSQKELEAFVEERKELFIKLDTPFVVVGHDELNRVWVDAACRIDVDAYLLEEDGNELYINNECDTRLVVVKVSVPS